LIVVVIMGVLASIAMPKFYPQKEKAVVAEAVGVLSAIRQGELAYKLEIGAYIEMPQKSGTLDWGVLGIDDPNVVPGTTTPNPRFQYSVTGTDDSAYATAKRGSTNVNASYQGKTLDLAITTGQWKTPVSTPPPGTHPFQPKNAS
jgi:type II secretory pathway pseudopilin PulG